MFSIDETAAGRIRAYEMLYSIDPFI